MAKQIFQDLTPEQRVTALKENAYETQKETVRRNFTPDEISEKKTSLSENTMMLLDEEETLT